MYLQLPPLDGNRTCKYPHRKDDTVCLESDEKELNIFFPTFHLCTCNSECLSNNFMRLTSTYTFLLQTIIECHLILPAFLCLGFLMQLHSGSVQKNLTSQIMLFLQQVTPL